MWKLFFVLTMFSPAVFAQEVDTSKIYAVTNKFGRTVIPLSSLPYASPMLDSGKRPWTSWWFPKSEHEFTQPHNGMSSILAKFDAYYSSIGEPMHALEEEQRIEGGGSNASWEGLCDAWAVASIMSPEPKQSLMVMVSQGGQQELMQFSVRELKGLLLKTYEAPDESNFDYYGEKFQGNQFGWYFPDLLPDQFHRLINKYLGEDKRAFMMDKDPGVEIWNVPVYRANYKMELVPGKTNEILVHLWVFTGGDANPQDRNAVGSREVVRKYAYILTGEVNSAKTALTVTGGRWIREGNVDSIADHPDFAWAPKGPTVQRKSYNSYITPARVDNLIRQSMEN